MKRCFAPNIEGKGRLVRGLMALALLIGAYPIKAAELWFAARQKVAGEMNPEPSLPFAVCTVGCHPI